MFFNEKKNITQFVVFYIFSQSYGYLCVFFFCFSVDHVVVLISEAEVNV